MPSLATIAYDPATAASASTATLIAMTAVDTTNLRNTFTAPANGIVEVRLRCQITGATTAPRILLGVLDGSTVRLRMTPTGSRVTGVATELISCEAVGLVTGLTPGNSYTWDAAYSVDIILASTNIKYGGPNDTAGADAYGAFSFEVWDTSNLLAGTTYDPASNVTKTMTGLLAVTAFDTTNARLTITAPTSGKIFWRIATMYLGSGTAGTALLAVLESATVVARSNPLATCGQSLLTTSGLALVGSGVISVSAGSHTFDAAYAVQVVSGGGGGLRYGGADDATTNNAFGGIVFEIWSA